MPWASAATASRSAAHRSVRAALTRTQARGAGARPRAGRPAPPPPSGVRRPSARAAPRPPGDQRTQASHPFVACCVTRGDGRVTVEITVVAATVVTVVLVRGPLDADAVVGRGAAAGPAARDHRGRARRRRRGVAGPGPDRLPAHGGRPRAVGSGEPGRPPGAAAGAGVAVAARAHRPGRAHRRRRAEPLRGVVRGDRRRRRRGRRQHRDPARLGTRLDLATRSSVGDGEGPGGTAVVAQVPVLGETGPQTGQVVGVVAVGQTYPSLGESLLSAVPTCSPTWGWRASSGSRGRCSSRAGSSGRPSGWSRWRSAGSSSTARPCSRGSRRA